MDRGDAVQHQRDELGLDFGRHRDNDSSQTEPYRRK
jgi:hypothetical protein